ncbi:MAG: hypothetical protein ACRD50_03650 [Candidatus Acidiferrales bacterium]
MRIRTGDFISGCLVLLTAVACALPARGQDTQMMPEQSAAKAKQLLHEAIEALGGAAYLHLHDATCTGRLSQFGHSGELMGYEKFIDYAIPPNMDRNENLPKRNIIEVINGDHGWVLDRGGVTDAPEDAIKQNLDDQKVDIDNLLRSRINEPGMVFRYKGPDVVDLKESDWVEIEDPDGRNIQIALAKATHLPIRKVVTLRDPQTSLRIEETEYYSNYHPIEGVMTPFQIARDRNGQKIFQAWIDECKYNTGISPDLFTKESLDARWAVVGKKEIKKQEKERKKVND